MKWKAKKAPELGTKKVTMHFAWVPVELSDGDTVWLEVYFKEHVFDWSSGACLWRCRLIFQ